MKKLALLIVALTGLSVMSLPASAYYVKCFRPCYHCKKVCKVYGHRHHDRDYRHHYRHHWRR